MLDKQSIDKAAEAEGIALDKLHANSRDKRLIFETSNHNIDELGKLFKKDK